MLKTLPKISIIVPIYNGERFLLNFLSSVDNLLWKNYEIILVDDGSNSETKKILDNYVKINPKAKVFHNKNHGSSYARNFGIKNSTGEYIYFADCDDILHPNILNVLIEGIIKNKADVSVCEYKIIGKRKFLPKSKAFNKIKYKIVDGKNQTMAMLLAKGGKWGILWNKLFKRSIIKQSKHYPNLLPEKILIVEDIIGNIIYFQNVKRMAITSKKLYYYRFFKQGLHNELHTKKNMTMMKGIDFIKNFNWSAYSNIDDYVRFACALFSMFFLWKIAKAPIKNDKIFEYYQIYKNWGKCARKCKHVPFHWRIVLPLARPYIYHTLKKYNKVPKSHKK